MTGLAIAIAAAMLYAAWLCRHLGGPFRPIRNQLEYILQEALIAGAAAILFFGIGLDLKAKGGAEAPPSCQVSRSALTPGSYGPGGGISSPYPPQRSFWSACAEVLR